MSIWYLVVSYETGSIITRFTTYQDAENYINTYCTVGPVGIRKVWDV